MATIDLTALVPVQVARVNAALEKQYRFEDGRVCSLRRWIEVQASIEKSESDGMAYFNRGHFNRLDGDGQAKYMASLAARRVFWVNGVCVPKIVYDVVR